MGGPGNRLDEALIEDADELAYRTGGIKIDSMGMPDSFFNDQQEATVALFQYMIGHLDWSVVALHNVVAFRRESGQIVAVPFDFDYAGLVNTEDAAAPPELGVRHVRQRLYRGFCRPGIDWDGLFERFRALEPEFSALLEEQEGIGARERRSARYFLDRFYRTIASETRRRERIIEACRPLPD